MATCASQYGFSHAFTSYCKSFCYLRAVKLPCRQCNNIPICCIGMCGDKGICAVVGTEVCAVLKGGDTAVLCHCA